MATIEEYLLKKYGRKGAMKVSKFIAESFGIPHPLSKGWLSKHGPREVTPYMIERLGIMAGVKQPRNERPLQKAMPIPVKIKNGPVVVVDVKKAKRSVALSTDVASKAFLASYEWRELRMKALKLYGAVCACCGASPKSGAVMNVDHIKCRKKFPGLALDIRNLQVLCEECNHGKGNWDSTDWRKTK